MSNVLMQIWFLNNRTLMKLACKLVVGTVGSRLSVINKNKWLFSLVKVPFLVNRLQICLSTFVNCDGYANVCVLYAIKYSCNSFCYL